MQPVNTETTNSSTSPTNPTFPAIPASPTQPAFPASSTYPSNPTSPTYPPNPTSPNSRKNISHSAREVGRNFRNLVSAVGGLTGNVARGTARGVGRAAVGTARGAGYVAAGTAMGVGSLAVGAKNLASGAMRNARYAARHGPPAVGRGIWRGASMVKNSFGRGVERFGNQTARMAQNMIHAGQKIQRTRVQLVDDGNVQN